MVLDAIHAIPVFYFLKINQASMSCLRFNIKEDSIGLLEWDQKDSSVNLISLKFIEELEGILNLLEKNPPPVLILLSRKPNHFCVGADIKALANISSVKELQKLLDRVCCLFLRFENLKTSKIAVISGACFGGGLEFAFTFDYRLLADSPSARLAFPELKLGLIPGFGGCLRLPCHIGLKASMDMILKSRILRAKPAFAKGLADDLIPPFALEQRAFHLARQIVQGTKPARPSTLYKRRGIWAFFWRQLFFRCLVFFAKRQVLKKTKGFYPAPLKFLDLIKKTAHSRYPLSAKNRELEKQTFFELFESRESKNLIRLWCLAQKAKKLRPKNNSLSKAQRAKNPLYKTQSGLSNKGPMPAHNKEQSSFVPDFAKTPYTENQTISAKRSGYNKERAIKHINPIRDEKGTIMQDKGNGREAKIQRVGIVGAGTMGQAIAFLLADKGFFARLVDNNDQSLCKALRFAQTQWKKQKQEGKINSYELRQRQNRLSLGQGFEGFSTLDLVIEALPEDFSIKSCLIKKISRCMHPLALLASNTSSLSIEKMAQHSLFPENFFGLHFFHPAERLPLVELILPPLEASLFPLTSVREFLNDMGKVPIVVSDSPGFLVNRLLAAFLTSALLLFEKGVGIQKIDFVYRDKFGFALGPFELMDKVGLDICVSTLLNLKQRGLNFSTPEWTQSLPNILGQGEKSGQGFYIYNKKTPSHTVFFRDLFLSFPSTFIKKKKPLNDKIKNLNRVSSTSSLTEWELFNFGLSKMIKSTELLLKEGVCSVEDIDLALVMGAGFPPASGGLMNYIKAKNSINKHLL